MKLIKKLLITLIVIVLLVIGVVAVAITTFDANAYKADIAEQVKEETGRDFNISGDINLTIYPWLGLEVSGVQLSNADGFGEAPFLNADTFKVRAKLLPLLRKELEMDTLILQGVNLNLAKNAEGKTNWDDLAKSGDKEKESSDSGLPFAALVLGGIDVKDVNILWQDQQAKTQSSIKGLRVSTGELKLGEPIQLKAGMDISASKPALSARVDFVGTASYQENGNVLTLNPFQLDAKVKGASVPSGETDIKLNMEVELNTDEELAQIKSLMLNAFGTEVAVNLDIKDYLDGTPSLNGRLDVKGDDLPQLFKVFEIEPLASQLSGIKQKQFSLSTQLEVDLKRNDVIINPLKLNVLGNAIKANLIAHNVRSEQPAVKGDINASGANLPLLITLLSQIKGDTSESVAALSKQLKSVPEEFKIETIFDLDMKAGIVELSKLAVDALGMNINGNASGKQLQSKQPELKGGVTIQGKNMPALIGIASVLSGVDKKEVAPLSKYLKSVPADYSIDTKFDSGEGAIKVSDLKINALGLNSNIELQIKNYLSDEPAVKGKLSAKGPDLPLLLIVAGSMQGNGSGLLGLAKQLANVKNKAFSLSTQFDADMDKGNIALPDMSFQSLGVTVAGSLTAKDLDSGGELNGNVAVNSQSPKPLLTAVGQGDFAKVVDSFKLSTNISGNAKTVSLKPLSFAAVVSGKEIPNSPVSLNVNADTDIDLEKEVLSLKGFKADGLGLDLKGNLTAKNWSKSVEYSGDINLAPFNLRQFLISLNQDVPKTADPKVLQKLGLSSGISGSGNSINLSGLKAELDDSRLQGDVKLISASPLNLEFGLGLDQLNLDRYLPPKKEGEKSKAATPETVAASAATEIPIETLRAVTIKGDFVMGKLIISNATLTDMELSVRAKEGDIKLSPIKAKLYDGTYEGDITLDATGKEPKLTTNTKLLGVQTGPLVKDVAENEDISGEANIILSLNSSGSDTNKLKQRLSGKGELKFLEGLFKGIDVNKVLSQVEIMYESKRFGTIDTSGETRFQSLTATMNINNGVVTNKDMLMLGNGFKVKGEGMMVNLNDETWKYNLNVIVDSSSATNGEERYNVGGYDILIKCRDKIMDKKCRPDLESMINALLKDRAKKKITEKLGDVIGIDLNKLTGGSKEPAPEKQTAESASQSEIQQKTAPAPAEIKPQQEKKKPEDLLKEELGKGLKKLFDF